MNTSTHDVKQNLEVSVHTTMLGYCGSLKILYYIDIKNETLNIQNKDFKQKLTYPFLFKYTKTNNLSKHFCNIRKYSSAILMRKKSLKKNVIH